MFSCSTIRSFLHFDCFHTLPRSLLSFFSSLSFISVLHCFYFIPSIFHYLISFLHFSFLYFISVHHFLFHSLHPSLPHFLPSFFISFITSFPSFIFSYFFLHFHPSFLLFIYSFPSFVYPSPSLFSSFSHMKQYHEEILSITQETVRHYLRSKSVRYFPAPPALKI